MSEQQVIRVLLLGAGVQSTTIALMIHRGEIEPIACAVFADTQEESAATYKHLEWLSAEVAPSFPVHIVSQGKLGADLLEPFTGLGRRIPRIPAFIHSEKPDAGMVPRQCTEQYKLTPVWKFIRQSLLGLKPGQRRPKDKAIAQLFGLSLDEPGRVARVRSSVIDSGCLPVFPLFAKALTRRDCIKWLEDYPVPHSVPRSACVFCPYKSNDEWARIKQADPVSWARAVEVDEGLRVPDVRGNAMLNNKIYLHRSCKPLVEVDFSSSDQRTGQSTFSFANECQGMCGV